MRSYAITLFVKQLKSVGVDYSELKDVSVWFSNGDGYYKLSAQKQNG